MHQEISIATQFLASFLPEEERQNFINDLSSILVKKFNGHWYPAQESKGSAFRSISILSKLDSTLRPLLNYSLSNLPLDFVLWIDPNNVSYRQGSNYIVKLWESPDARKPLFAPIVSVSLKHPSPPPAPPQQEPRFPLQPIVA